MRARSLSMLCAGVIACAVFSTAKARAQDSGDSDQSADSAGSADQPADSGGSADQPADSGGSDTASPDDSGGPPPESRSGATNKEAIVADAEQGNSPLEHPGQVYRFVGLRYRGIIVPKFMENMFGADGGRTVYISDFGPEFAIRKDNFSYIFSLTYASYAMQATPFKSNSDNEDAWELVTSKLSMINLKADFLWSTPFSPEFALNYGIGAGFGIVFGDLHRVQAYKNKYGNYEPCTAPGNPAPGSAESPSSVVYCGNDNKHYNNYKEPSWANGGSKPILFPWLAFQTGFRFKPTKHFVARLDAGFGTSGFFFGLGADYGL